MKKTVKQSLKRFVPSRLFRSLEPQYHLLEASFSVARHGYPAKGMHIIGVTGTNGKTTTANMIHRMLVDAGYKSALMTTVCYGVGNDLVPQQLHMTTASAPELQQRIAAFRRQGAEWLVLETTSHALAQHRVWGVPYEIGVMTNVTHEHLDYHRTFQRYLDAKLSLFRIAAKHGRAFGVYNADDPSADQWNTSIPRSISYGISHGQLRATHVQLSGSGVKYQARYDDAVYDISCAIPGEFNVYNSLATVAVGIELGLTKKQIEQGIAALSGVEGRMNRIDEGQPYQVIVDFAHTPDSFERLLSDLRASTSGKLIALFGSAGRRDEAKRAVQGEIAGKYCDEVILTEEDDRDIDGGLILDQIASGAERVGKVRGTDLFLIRDRSEAITYAISRAQTADDVVVLLGKGHEKVIERADGEHPWDEVDTARRAIQICHRA